MPAIGLQDFHFEPAIGLSVLNIKIFSSTWVWDYVDLWWGLLLDNLNQCACCFGHGEDGDRNSSPGILIIESICIVTIWLLGAFLYDNMIRDHLRENLNLRQTFNNGWKTFKLCCISSYGCVTNHLSFTWDV